MLHRAGIGQPVSLAKRVPRCSKTLANDRLLLCQTPCWRQETPPHGPFAGLWKSHSCRLLDAANLAVVMEHHHLITTTDRHLI